METIILWERGRYGTFNTVILLKSFITRNHFRRVLIQNYYNEVIFTHFLRMISYTKAELSRRVYSIVVLHSKHWRKNLWQDYLVDFCFHGYTGTFSGYLFLNFINPKVNIIVFIQIHSTACVYIDSIQKFSLVVLWSRHFLFLCPFNVEWITLKKPALLCRRNSTAIPVSKRRQDTTCHREQRNIQRGERQVHSIYGVCRVEQF